jgi:hypothetical protein
MYSNIRSRAGLAALVFALISISLVSALPISFPASQSELSSTLSPSSSNHDGHNHIQHDTRRVAKFSVNDQMSRALILQHTSIDTDNDQLVRRNIFSKIKKGFQNLGHDIKHVAQKVGSGIKKAAQTVGSGIKKVAQKVGSGIKQVAQKVGSGIKTAAKKVGNFVKTTGAKIAKFGFKVVQSVGMAIGDVASFIPDVGKPLQQAINGVSKVAGVVSDHIHAKLSAKLNKGMSVMNTANKIMSVVRRDLSDEETFQQRDISDTYYSGEADWDDISLTLEHSYFDNDYNLDHEHWE